MSRRAMRQAWPLYVVSTMAAMGACQRTAIVGGVELSGVEFKRGYHDLFFYIVGSYCFNIKESCKYEGRIKK